MPTARKYQISLSDTPYYHCISQCVRRAFLCGDDHYSGKNYDHRKQWVADRLKVLAKVFSIEVCAFAIMSNHTHLVLKVNEKLAKNWTISQVIERWTQLFRGGELIRRYQTGEPLSDVQIEKINELAEIWRERLINISWFMRCLNEPIARRANAEDNCKGKFWSSRFKSQALLDEQAVLACMVYIDLNPIRAGICQNLESSEYTSINQRLKEHINKKPMTAKNKTKSLRPTFPSRIPTKTTNIPLANFTDSIRKQAAIPYALTDYFELVDWTGRAVRDDKLGSIPADEPTIISKLGIASATWLTTVKHFNDSFYTFVGPEIKLKKICERQKKKWLLGITLCKKLFHHQNPILQ